MGGINLSGKKKDEPTSHQWGVVYSDPEKYKNTDNADKENKIVEKIQEKKKKFSQIDLKEYQKLGVDVNLVHEVKAEHKTSPVLRAAFIGLFFILLVYLALFFWQLWSLDSMIVMQSEIKKIDKEIASFDTLQKKVKDFSEKLNGALTAWDSRVYWTNFFNNLEKNTLPQIAYTNFSGSSSGTVILQAQANSLKDVSDQIRIFKESPIVESVEMNNISQKINTETGEKKYDLNISLKVKKDAFDK